MREKCIPTSTPPHEATFDDDEKGKGEAIRKRHSMVEEAMGIANQIDLDSILMTHFSQRYPKFPPGHDADTIKAQGEYRDTSTSTSTCSNGLWRNVDSLDGWIAPNDAPDWITCSIDLKK